MPIRIKMLISHSKEMNVFLYLAFELFIAIPFMFSGPREIFRSSRGPQEGFVLRLSEKFAIRYFFEGLSGIIKNYAKYL